MIGQTFLQWLLETKIPSIRYLTLSRLLELPGSDIEIQRAWEAMKSYGPIPDILAPQTEAGSWRGEHSFYTPKYTSTHWSMLLLTELAADPEEPRLQRSVNFMLGTKWKPLERHLKGEVHGLTCFWANLLRYSLYFGHRNDPRLEVVIALLANEAMQFGWRCEYNDGIACSWGVARTIWALAAIPVDHRSPETQSAIQSGLDFLLKDHDLLRVNYPIPAGGKIHPTWSRLNFPLFYQADVLFVLRALSELDELDHPGAQEALSWLQSRRGANGHWRGASPFRRRTWKSLGGQEETNRWVSLQSALILKSAGRLG